MDTKEFLTLAIPSEIRTMEHPDGHMITNVLVTALGAYKDSPSHWAKNIAGDIHRALMVCLEETIKPHLLKEDEDWSALKARAEATPVIATEAVAEVTAPQPSETVTVKAKKALRAPANGWTFNYSGAANGSGEVRGVARDGVVTFFADILNDKGDSIATAKAVYANQAVRKAFKKAGLSLSAMPHFSDETDSPPTDINPATLSHPSSLTNDRLNEEIAREPVER